MTTTEDRVTHTEMAIQNLTSNMSILTKDVQSLVDSQKEISGLVRDQALQNQDQEYTKKALDRAFVQIEDHENEVRAIRLDVAEIKTSMAVCQSQRSPAARDRAGDAEAEETILRVMIKYWPIIAGVLVAGGGGGAAIKTALGAG